MPIEKFSSIVSYYADCFRADGGELSFWNVFKLKPADYCVIKGREYLACEELPRLPIDPEKAKKLQQEAELYTREKTLVYGLLCISGQLNVDSGLVSSRQLCSPIYYYTASITFEDGDAFVSFSSKVNVNWPLVRSILKDDIIDSALEMFPIPKARVEHRDVLSLVTWLEQYSQVRECLSLLHYPKLSTESELQDSSNSKKSLSALSSATLTLVDKPRHSRGIDHELRNINKGSLESSPCRALFGQAQTVQPTASMPQPELLPVILSQAQQQALHIAASETLGLVSGPPGTGKTLTIAAIVADRLLSGETCLIVSETEQAVEVVADKLASHFGIDEGVVRAGRAEYLKELKSYLNDLLKTGVNAEDKVAVRGKREQLSRTSKIIEKLEKQFIRRSKLSVKWGDTLNSVQANSNANIIQRLQIRWIKSRIAKSVQHWDLIETIERTEKNKKIAAFDYIRSFRQYQLGELLDNHRTELNQFNKAIRARSSSTQQSLFDEIDYGVLLNAFPIWIVSLSTLHKVLPLIPELFDLTIFDEATQCNIASSIPAMLRSKRTLLVGDAKQLSHSSFLAAKTEKQLLEKNNLPIEQYDAYSYRNNSILHKASDNIATQSSVTFLDEHFRSKPDLIAFSNKHFYRSRLKVMQHRPDSYNTGNWRLLVVNGERDKKGINKIEAQYLIDQLAAIIESNERLQEKPSIGIISPYRAQADYLQKLVEKNFSYSIIEQYQLRTGTPYHFQGSERDIVLLSFAICKNSLRASSYLNKEDMFNVAVTRARQQQLVFLSLSKESLNSNNLLRKYLEHYHTTSIAKAAPTIFEEEVQEVCRTLESHKLKTWQGYPIAGQTMDILCEYDKHFVAIDLIGFPGEYADFFEINAYKVFHRAGLKVIPISYGLWTEQQALCVRMILRELGINL